jgi:hypothetical protein
MACAGCDVHHTGPGADGIPRHPGSRGESGLAAQFIAVFTGHGIHCVATREETAAGESGPTAHMSSWREHEHVITMRRPSPGIHWRVTHLESMTQLLVMRMRGEPSGRVPPRCRAR